MLSPGHRYQIHIQEENHMITNLLIFFAGAMIGLITMALAAVAGDAERCEDCLRMREEIQREEELERIKRADDETN